MKPAREVITDKLVRRLAKRAHERPSVPKSPSQGRCRRCDRTDCGRCRAEA